ncbi:MAG: LPP20 family lipoprotein [Chlamydiota bacterium]|nr:LPP20 family lipoprotein [Chlamydiota bacterium]
MRIMKLSATALLTAVLMMFLGQQGFALSPGQQKLLAKRAATVDAYRNLAEQIKGLKIDSNTYVRDFVAESDEIATSLDTFIKGIRISGAAIYYDDGSCEVSVEVTLQQVVLQLKRYFKTYRHLCHEHTYSFDRMEQVNKLTVIRAKGHGAPREEAPGYGEPVGYTAPTAVNPSAGVPGWENVTARGRLMAERAAKVDAYRKLAEHIKGIQITSNTYVRDFVAESDEISTRLDTFIKGVKQLGPYRYMPDGIVECDVQVAIQTVVKELTTIRDWQVTHYPGHRWHHAHLRTTRFEEILNFSPKKHIRATGEGVPPEKYTRPSGPEPVAYAPAAPSSPSWATQVVRATGTGIPPEGAVGAEAQLMAARAAELDAKRNLTEMVYGVNIDSRTTVRDFAVQNDTINADVRTFLAGAVVGEPRFLPDGSAEVDVELALDGLYNRLRDRQII